MPHLAFMAKRVVMVAFGEETKMHYPVMTERQVAARWKVSLKTMRRWWQAKVGQHGTNFSNYGDNYGDSGKQALESIH
jgi:hypothetical protein